MNEPVDRAQVKAVADALLKLDEPVRRRFARQADLPEATAPELAARLSDPSFLRGAVRTLDAPARAVLRLLPKLSLPVAVRDVDAVAEILAPAPHASGTASEQLCAAGLAAVDDQRPPHLRTLAPLRARLASLAHESWPSWDEPASESDEAYLEHLLTFRLGLTLAATESARPRATRLRELHRGDESVLAELVAPAFTRPEEATELLRHLARQRTLVARDGRFSVRFASLDGWDDPAARMVVEAFSPWRHDAGLLTVLARLLAEDRWHSLPAITELLAIAVLRRAYTAGAKSDLARYLTMLDGFPGLHREEHDGTLFVRLTQAARRAFGAESAPLAATRARLLVQPNLQVVAQLGTPLPTLARLGRIARLLSTGRAAVFALDEQAIRRAASEGFAASAMLSFLEREAVHGVPSTVARALTDWARAKGRATLVTGTVVLTDLPPDEVERLAGSVRAISPGVYLVPTEHARALATALRREGISTDEAGESDEDAWADEPEPWRTRAERIARDAQREAERTG